MMQIPFFGKKEQITKKSASTSGRTDRTFIGALEEIDMWDMSFKMLFEYYKRCAPFASAVNEKADAASEIPLRVWDKNTKEYVEHPVLNLLSYPNDSMSQSDLIRQLMSVYAITGNPFTRALGPVKRPPLALRIEYPQFAQIKPDGAGNVRSIKIENRFGSKIYMGDVVDGRKRYRSGNDNEIWHIYSFNPDAGTDKFFGAPLARPLYYDIETYIYGGKHNKSMLKKGARPSGAISINPDENISDDEWVELKQQMREQLQGADNAGEVLLLLWGKFEQMSMTNKDMDYKTLIENASTSIDKQFKIPLPLTSSAAMTYSNFAAAQVALYDRAVMPDLKFLLQQLGMMLFYRYNPKDWQRYILTFDEKDIPALIARRVENMKNMGEAKSFTVDELRAEVGYDELPDNQGKEVWKPSSETPISESGQENNGE